MHETSLKTDTFETTACPVCHQKDSDALFAAPDRFDLDAGEAYRLVTCRRCSLIYLNPRPVEAESARFYASEAYDPFLSTKEEASLYDKLYVRLRQTNNVWKRRKIEKLVSEKGRILDVGCGTGEFLVEMQSAGWEARGVERDVKAASFAIQQYGLRVVAGEIGAVPAVPGSFDVVTMWHVLEHLYDPHKVVMKIRDFLKPGGLLVIAVPNAASIDAAVYRQNWIALDAPRHLLHFNLKALRSLCEMHKFSLVKKLPLPLDALFNALMSERLLKKRKHVHPALMPFFYLRAALVASVSLLAGVFNSAMKTPKSSTLITIWKKET